MEPSQLPLLLGAAVLLPLAAFFVVLLFGPLLGKENGAYWSTGAIVGAAVLSFASLVIWVSSAEPETSGGHESHASRTEHDVEQLAERGVGLIAEHGPPMRLVSVGVDEDSNAKDSGPAKETGHAEEAGHAGETHASGEPRDEHQGHINGPPRHITGNYYILGRFGFLQLTISYYIDSLTIGMFCVVSLIASCIHFYAMGYMHDELHDITDHEVTLENGEHLKRPGRYYRFFQYLSLFCFSMLGLVLAGNIAMVFVFWELVGICSYFLIGFYVERPSAMNAANKAFIVNRVGDFGMIIGLMALWTGLGTFAFGDMTGPHGGHLVELVNAEGSGASIFAEWTADTESDEVTLHVLDAAREPIESDSAGAVVSWKWRGESSTHRLSAAEGHFSASDGNLAAALGTFNDWTKPRLAVEVDGKHYVGNMVRQDGIFSRLRPESNDYQIRVPERVAAATAPAELIAVADSASLSQLEDTLRESIDSPPEKAPPVISTTLSWAGDWIRYGAVQVINVLPTVSLDARQPETLGNRLGAYYSGYWLLIIAGVGIFCGCAGKSAQFPLHVWLPDAMEGPTPVSALVHSATMVAAGVYLVGRFFPTFTPEVLFVIATIGCITLFMAATIAITATDIKRVLAYSTVSQLGYMMLALGVGGWVAGLMHLVTHAFFKSLLFMCSGSVIHAVHTNEMPQMGGLLKKMPITGLTMLVGCLAISGVSVPFVVGFSGYYSKDAILEQAFSFMQHNQGSFFPTLFFVTAASGAAITAFYMFRLWYLTFLGKPRDQHRYDHAHESPKVMYMPLIILAVFATGVAWQGALEAVYVASGAAVLGVVVYVWHQMTGADNESLKRGKTISVLLIGSGAALGLFAAGWSLTGINLHDMLESARPAGTTVNSHGVLTSLTWPDEHYAHQPAQFWSIVFPVTMLATATALGGILLATVMYAWGYLNPGEVRRQFNPVYNFLINKWYFDELYNWMFVKPLHMVSRVIAVFDRRWIDGFVDATARTVRRLAVMWERLADQIVVDGFVDGLAKWTYSIGLSLRAIQTGSLRQYIMFIVIALLAIFVLISVFWSPTLAQ